MARVSAASVSRHRTSADLHVRAPRDGAKDRPSQRTTVTAHVASPPHARFGRVTRADSLGGGELAEARRRQADDKVVSVPAQDRQGGTR